MRLYERRCLSMNALIKLPAKALIVAVILCPSVQNQVTNQSTKTSPVKGLKCTYPKVEVISRQLFTVNGQGVESPVSLTDYTICDEQRRTVESGELLNGDPDIKNIVRYDENGNEIEHEFWTHDSLTHKDVSRYDSSGRIIRTTNDDGTRTFCINRKNRSSCRVLESDGSLKLRWVRNYDSLGRRIGQIENELGRGRTHRYLYGYDHWGNMNLEADYYRFNGKDQNSRSIFTFNEKGKLIEKLWYDESGLRTREIYEYNSRDDLSRRTEFNGDKVIVEEMTLEYQSYDAKGNWSKAVERRIRLDKGKITLDIRRVLYRTITYPGSSAIA